MVVAYKLTDVRGYTRRHETGETHWLVGETVAPMGKGIDACGPGVLHLYANAEEAMLYDSLHGSYTRQGRARLFTVETEAISGDDGFKQWTTHPVTVTEELTPPEITLEERVAWVICLAPHRSTRAWAIDWLSGTDQSLERAKMTATWSEGWKYKHWAKASAADAVWLAVEMSWVTVEENFWVAEKVRWAAATMAMKMADKLMVGEFRARSMAALSRARAILRKEIPAEEYAGTE